MALHSPQPLGPLDQFSRRWLPAVEAALDQALPPAETAPAELHQAMRYAVLGGGKRLRPLLCLAACEAVGGEPAQALPAAAALELIHAYSLVHDDLPCMDDDDLRRGRPTCHRVYGEATALLAGDALQTLAFQVVAEWGLSRSDSSQGDQAAALAILAEIARAAGSQGMVGGQVLDLQGERGLTFESGDHALEHLRAIHRGKTGSLFVAAVRSGAIAGGAGQTELSRLTAFAWDFGLAFQIVDDLLDVVGDAAKIGKPVGSDAKNQRLSYAALLGVEGARQQAAAAVRRAVAHLHEIKLRGDGAVLQALAQAVIERDH